MNGEAGGATTVSRDAQRSDSGDAIEKSLRCASRLTSKNAAKRRMSRYNAQRCLVMIVGYHIIFSTYGFWLSNDPRGSWSTFVGSWDLFRYGAATKTEQRGSLAYRQHNHDLRRQAKSALKYQPVQFTGTQARAVARGFGSYVRRSGLSVWACAILPDHVHLVTGRLATSVEQLVIQLKGEATRQLEREGIHPLAAWKADDGRSPKCWVRGQWKVYLDPEDVDRAIDYCATTRLKRESPGKSGRLSLPARSDQV